MKRVLFIAYHFPPVGGGGVQRSLKFVKYLPHFGYAPVVLTAGKVPNDRWSPRDDALLRELPPDIPIHRINGLPAQRSGGRWERRFREWSHTRSAFARAWMAGIMREGSRVCAALRPELIFVTLSPFEGAHAAAALARRHDIPWVADLRDPWALDEMQVYPSGLHRQLERLRMRHALRDASLVIMNTPEAARRLCRAFPEYRRRRVVSITNGFDAADYRTLVRKADRSRFRIVHTGSLHASHGRLQGGRRRLYEALGRIERGVDFLPRSHVHLLSAVQQWVDRDPRVASRIEIVLAGNLTEADRAVVDASAVRGLVKAEGHLSHPATAQLQVDADLLFLPMHHLPPDRRATIVPGKTYEYLAAGSPILAAVPEGDARDFILGARAGECCAPSDVEAIGRLLQARFEAWERRGAPPPADAAFIEQFERRRLTERLANEFVDLGANAPEHIFSAVADDPAEADFPNLSRRHARVQNL